MHWLQFALIFILAWREGFMLTYKLIELETDDDIEGEFRVY